MLAWPETTDPATPARTTILRHRIRARTLPPARVALLRELFTLADYLAEHPDIPVDTIEIRASACHLRNDVDGRAYIDILAAELEGTSRDVGHFWAEQRLSEHVDYRAHYIPLAARYWEKDGAADD